MNFSLRQHHGYSLTEIEDAYPFERDLYVDLLNDWIAKEEQKKAQQG